MNQYFQLDGKIAVITGAEVTLCARNTEKLNALKIEMEKENGIAPTFT